jgi:hypothetical protein
VAWKDITFMLSFVKISRLFQKLKRRRGQHGGLITLGFQRKEGKQVINGDTHQRAGEHRQACRIALQSVSRWHTHWKHGQVSLVRSVFRFCFRLLVEAYEAREMWRKQVLIRCNAFKNGRTDAEDKQRPERPSTSTPGYTNCCVDVVTRKNSVYSSLLSITNARCRWRLHEVWCVLSATQVSCMHTKKSE